MDGLTRTIAKVPNGLEPICDLANTYCGIEYAAEKVHIFARQDAKLKWVSASFSAGQDVALALYGAGHPEATVS